MPHAVCPPLNDHGYLCGDSCVSNSQCGNDKYCCEVNCGKTCLTRVQQTQSAFCPPKDRSIACFAFIHACNNDGECNRDGRRGYCCLEPACGRRCVQV
ncbi:whey acidic protein-like [Homarus americanus]|uniref:whey acidic protein-like n=1 Tax=Homarus americanus TaxID=6706 RepID=UPI001C4926A4|nr:whey acidic protein-like [Homarus americanus]